MLLLHVKAAARLDGVPVYPEAQKLAMGLQVEPAAVLAQGVDKRSRFESRQGRELQRGGGEGQGGRKAMWGGGSQNPQGERGGHGCGGGRVAWV